MSRTMMMAAAVLVAAATYGVAGTAYGDPPDITVTMGNLTITTYPGDLKLVDASLTVTNNERNYVLITGTLVTYANNKTHFVDSMNRVELSRYNITKTEAECPHVGAGFSLYPKIPRAMNLCYLIPSSDTLDALYLSVGLDWWAIPLTTNSVLCTEPSARCINATAPTPSTATESTTPTVMASYNPSFRFLVVIFDQPVQLVDPSRMLLTSNVTTPLSEAQIIGDLTSSALWFKMNRDGVGSGGITLTIQDGAITINDAPQRPLTIQVAKPDY